MRISDWISDVCSSDLLEDYRAALGFLVRAEQTRPRDGTIKAALGSAMVHMENPTRALDYFGEAQLLGAPERLFLADRGLARDLLGHQDRKSTRLNSSH